MASVKYFSLTVFTDLFISQRWPAWLPLPSATAYCRAVTSNGAAVWATVAHQGTNSHSRPSWPAYPMAPGAACFRSAYVRITSHSCTLLANFKHRSFELLTPILWNLCLHLCICSQVLWRPRHTSQWFQRGSEFHLSIRSVLQLFSTSDTGRHSNQTLWEWRHLEWNSTTLHR